MIKAVFIVAAIGLSASDGAFAATEACETQAAQKKLSVVAKASYIKQCQTAATEAATKACGDQAEAKQLSAGATTKFVKKCVKEATRKHPPNAVFSGIG